MAKREWPVVIEECEWYDSTRRYTCGHHSDEAFVKATVAAGMYDKDRSHPPLVREYWRFVPIPGRDYGLTIIVAAGPGHGAIPVTAEAVE